VLDHIPLWVAPNLITLAGLICTVVTNVIMMYYCPKLEGHAPTWAYWANGICFFLYQTLDAVDGKQARRTGSSGPLGLLFDHGCDAINTTVSSLTLLATIQMGPTSWSEWSGERKGGSWFLGEREESASWFLGEREERASWILCEREECASWFLGEDPGRGLLGERDERRSL
jgi:hypothetical protein